MDFEVFRDPLIAALRRSGRGNGGKPPFEPVLVFRILVLQGLYSLSDEATEFQIRDRLLFQRVLGLGLNGCVPDATTVWLFRKRPVVADDIGTDPVSDPQPIPFLVKGATRLRTEYRRK